MAFLTQEIDFDQAQARQQKSAAVSCRGRRCARAQCVLRVDSPWTTRTGARLLQVFFGAGDVFERPAKRCRVAFEPGRKRHAAQRGHACASTACTAFKGDIVRMFSALPTQSTNGKKRDGDAPGKNESGPQCRLNARTPALPAWHAGACNAVYGFPPFCKTSARRLPHY